MENIYIFDWLSKQEIAYFLLMWQNKVFKKWEIIIKEWESSNNQAYVIKSWSVNISKLWQYITNLKSWDIFWELALIVDEPRFATVTAHEDTEVLIFIKDDFLMLCQKSAKYEEIKNKILSRIKDNFYRND